MTAALAYVGLIAAVNVLFGVVPTLNLPDGAQLSPVAFLVGAVFVLRDMAQREVGHGVLVAMAVGIVLSYLLADPFIATASAIAFAISEAIDWAVYSAMRGRPFRDRVLTSSAISVPVDSAAFLVVAGFFSWPTMVAMVVSKMFAAIALWAIERRPTE